MFPNKVPDTWIFQNGFWLSIFLDIHCSWSFYWHIVDIWLGNMRNLWLENMGNIVMEDRHRVSCIAPYGVWKVEHFTLPHLFHAD